MKRGYKINIKSRLLKIAAVFTILFCVPVFATDDVLTKYIGTDIYDVYPFLYYDMNDEKAEYKNQGIQDGGHFALGKHGWFFSYDNVINALLEKTKFIDDDYVNNLSDEIIKLNNLLKSKNKKIYFMIPPVKESVYTEYLPDTGFKVNGGYDDIKYFTDMVEKKTGVTMLYPLNILLEAKKYIRLYFLKDSHWNQLAGYIATCALYEKMGMEFTPLSSQGLTRINDEYNYVIYYKGNIIKELYEGDYANAYEIIYESDSINNKTITIIGDSFRYWIANKLRMDFKYCNILRRDHLKDIENAPSEINDSDIIIVEAIPSACRSIIDIVKFLEKCVK